MTMTSVAAARTKARTRLASSMAAWAAENTSEIRFEIALRPPTEKQVLADQAAAADWAGSWRAVGSSASSAGLEIDWAERNWARIGRQSVPVRLRLTTPDAVAGFVGGDTERAWRTLRDRAAALRDRFAGPTDGSAAIRSHAKRILSLSDPAFATVIDVVDWLRTHRLGSLRPRQLPIRGVDSKWFETHRSLVTALLSGIGHADAVTVLDAAPRLRLRILDPQLGPGAGFEHLDDLTAPIAQLGRLPISPSLVFVFENLESVLAMPAWPGAVAVHGSGYAVDGVARLDWIADARIIYWGDLDSHGFAILNRLRSYLPAVESVLMDETTLLTHRDLWVSEPKPSTGTFAHLSGTETRALDRIRAAGNVRLEQERIPWDAALRALRTAVSAASPNRLGEGSDPGTGHVREGQGHLGEGLDDDR